MALQGSDVPIAGSYATGERLIRFTPMYGFDGGRSYEATFNPAKVPGASPLDSWRALQTSHVFGFDSPGAQPATEVRQVYPGGTLLPANMLRMYIEFTAPMGRGSVLEHVRLLDDQGEVVVDPFLPLEAELWSPDRTRFTLLFDPGRVKRDIKPNRDLGRALVEGRRYTLVIEDEWIDGRGQPLRSAHRHGFTVGPAIEQPLDHGRWRIEAPRASTRDALVVTFPWALDHGLLQRALAVRRGGVDVPGEGAVMAGDTRWALTPRDPWTAGDYTLVVLTTLEDPAGNRIGRAFEVTRERVEGPDRVERPFTIRLRPNSQLPTPNSQSKGRARWELGIGSWELGVVSYSGIVATILFGSSRHTFAARRFDSHTEPRPKRIASPPSP